MIECNACGGLMVVTHTRQTKRGEYKRFACKACDNRMSVFGGVEHVNVKPVRLPSSSRRLSAAAVFAIRESVEKNRQLADRYGCSYELIRQIRAGLVYRDLLPAEFQRPAAAGGASCERCCHWEIDDCGMGFPDPLEEGPGFARDCSLYEAVR